MNFHPSRSKKRSLVVFSDLDGTLLDHSSYSYEAAEPVLRLLNRKKIPLILCSSKTAAEIDRLRQKLGLTDPFISENGGAIFVPRGYFGFPLVHSRETPRYEVIELGFPYARLRDFLGEIERQYPGAVRGFGDMDAEEVSRLTRLSLDQACLAKQRDYDEPFLIKDSQLEAKIVARARARGIQVTRGGRFFHLLGGNDKGKAVSILTDLFRRQRGNLITIGAGDSLNDLAMLKAVDYPILVQKPDSSYDAAVKLPHLILAPAPGPQGFCQSLKSLIHRLA